MTDNAHQAKLDAVHAKVSNLPKDWQVPLVLGIFIGTRGRIWRDRDGYHARVYASSPVSLQPLLTVLGGRVWPMARGKVVWNLNGKEKILWLARLVGQIVPDFDPGDLTPPQKRKATNCRHCGGEDGHHHEECIDHVGQD